MTMPNKKPNHSNTGDGPTESETVSPYSAGLKMACPKCGQTSAFSGLLTLKEACEVCGFDLSDADPGDGPAVFVILIVGTLTAILGVMLGFLFESAPVLLFLILSVFVVGASLLFLRMSKALLIALQFHFEAREGQLEPGKDEPEE